MLVRIITSGILEDEPTSSNLDNRYRVEDECLCTRAPRNAPIRRTVLNVHSIPSNDTKRRVNV